jgi:antitoxin HigA-1
VGFCGRSSNNCESVTRYCDNFHAEIVRRPRSNGANTDSKALVWASFRVNEIINGKRAKTSETAVLLSKALGISAKFWMNLQTAVDLFDAERKLAGAADAVHCLLPTPPDFIVETPA